MSVDGKEKVAILGGGHIGRAIARGLAASGSYSASDVIITRRNVSLLDDLKEQGFVIQKDNRDAVKKSDIIIIAVQPKQMNTLIDEIREDLDPARHTVMSVVTGATVDEILGHIGKEMPVVRVMPNTAIAIGESMTCISSKDGNSGALEKAKVIFDSVGKTFVIDEALMVPATALCACGIAFFLRAIRAASQGGIEIGFHSEEALPMAAQTAKGAASLLLSFENHPEMEIDKVTTPKGCTISGINEMEHRGFSSAMIKGIVTSAEKAAALYSNGE